MWNAKLLFTLFAVSVATLTVRAHNSHDGDTEHVKFYELKKGNLVVNFTNFGARIVSLNIPDKFGNISDIVLGYDSVDAYQEDKFSLGAIVGKVANRLHKSEDKDDNGGRVGQLSNAIWKVLKHDKSGKFPFITFQYDSQDEEEEEEEGEEEGEEEEEGEGEGEGGKKLIITATYLLRPKNKLQLTLYAEAKDEEATSLNLAQKTYWNLGGHNSSGDVLHDHLRVLASNYRQVKGNNRILPVKSTPYDFQRFHPIQSKFHKLKNGYHVDYVLDHHPDRNVELAAVLRDKRSGRVMKVWTDEVLLQFRTGDEVRNVRGKAGILYQKNAGLVLSPQGYPDTVITKEKPYNRTTVFEFVIKK